MSILKVDTINGKTTGNGVVIPSGQTLNVSAGTFVPSSGQVVQCVFRDDSRGHIATSSTSYVASGISHSITPKFADSTILIHYHIPMSHTPNSNGTLVPRIYRNGTDLSSNSYSQGFHTNGNQYITMTLECKDSSHNSTSAITYEVYFRSTNGGQTFLCHNGSDTHLKLWEIKA